MKGISKNTATILNNIDKMFNNLLLIIKNVNIINLNLLFI